MEYVLNKDWVLYHIPGLWNNLHAMILDDFASAKKLIWASFFNVYLPCM
jgi:hypothetical protein